MDTQEIWPTRCGADYVANLAPARNWDVAAAICQMRVGCDVGEVGRAVLADMPLRASRIGAEGGVSFPEEGLTVRDGKGAVRANIKHFDIPYRFRTTEGELQGVGTHSAIGCDANEVIREIVKWCSRYDCQFIELTDEGVIGFQKLVQLGG